MRPKMGLNTNKAPKIYIQCLRELLVLPRAGSCWEWAMIAVVRDTARTMYGFVLLVITCFQPLTSVAASLLPGIGSISSNETLSVRLPTIP